MASQRPSPANDVELDRGKLPTDTHDGYLHQTQPPSQSASSVPPVAPQQDHERQQDRLGARREPQDDVAHSARGENAPVESIDPTKPPTDNGGRHQQPLWRKIYTTVTWIPPRCRWDPDQPPTFSMPLNILFAFAGAFTVANLYYNHPILNILARDFDVPYSTVSQIPTLAQAGYAIGLAFLCPLGDLWPRRPFVLILVFFTATVSIGLCVTTSFAAFTALQFIIGVATVTPQLMLPLVGDLAPPQKRAAALSVVVAGLMLGILVARLLSGIVTNYTSWRNVYWMSVGLQYAIFASLWWCMPDYPATNKSLNYFKMLWSILVMLTKYPVLVQACLISFFTSAPFTSFWTDLTFLLAGPPYHYSPIIIGLFALIGIFGMLITPFYAKHIIDRFVPLFSVICGLLYCLTGICLGAYLGTFSVAGPILQAWFLDFGMQTAQISNRTAIYTIEPRARNRVNTAFMVATFLGQLTGTIVGAHLYAEAGGWIPSQSYSVASIGVALLLSFARGPWEERWLGWKGGWSVKKKNRDTADGKDVEVGNHLQDPRAMAVGMEKESRDRERGQVDLEKGSPSSSEDRGISSKELVGGEEQENEAKTLKSSAASSAQACAEEVSEREEKEKEESP